MDKTISATRTGARLFAEFAGFAALLFVTRFVARSHLVQRMDQECHIGGIALDLLAHGVRFPLTVYAPNEYDNGSFFSGVLTAVSFSLLGRNVLALKLVTHFISAAGAVAALSILRGCLRELKLTASRTRWVATAALVIAVASAPRVVTIFSTYAVGNHAEGTAINTLLLALFAFRWRVRSPTRTAAFWALVGFALYLNKGTLLVIPVLAVMETVLSWRSPIRLLAACGGFVLGTLLEVRTVIVQYGAGPGYVGWVTMLGKEDRNSQVFPDAFLNTIWFMSEYRFELLAVWILALSGGVALLVRSCLSVRNQLLHQGSRHAADAAAVLPVSLALCVGVSCFHLAALTVMAKDGLDAYVIYGYPTLIVLFGVLVALTHRAVVARWGDGPGNWTAGVLIVATCALYRPDAATWGTEQVSALWRNRAGAACSWRFAEGFEREVEYGLVPAGQTREQHAIDRCRLLSEEDQVLDCIGGIARELLWRQPDGRVHGEPPAELSAAEKDAYAYMYGTHRKGNVAACSDFDNPRLAGLCAAAVDLECLHYADVYTHFFAARGIEPQCPIFEPPLDGFWATRRLDLLARTAGIGPHLERAWGDDDLTACEPVFRRCS